MDIIASGEEEITEVPMDTGGADEASGWTVGSREPDVGGESSTTLDFPWPLGFTTCTKGQKEDTSGSTDLRGTISVSSDCYNMNHRRGVKL